jgi:hypothetical protein
MNPRSADFCFPSHCEKGQNVGCGDEGTASIANDAAHARRSPSGTRRAELTCTIANDAVHAAHST